ncbi:MAG: ABC transporter substrate-binding protein [Chloroflexota bacterium]
MFDITLALDWTPNTNHTGFYVALAEGYYEKAGINLTIHTPDMDNYKLSPAKRTAEKLATFGVAPSESIISYHTLSDAHPRLVAVAALLQTDTSAIVTLKDSRIERPAQLDGKVYASYNARFEDAIVAQLIRSDGGTGEFESITPAMLGVPNTLVDGIADATWVFMAWEGIQAQRDGINFNAFALRDYDVPYGYTPTLLSHPDTLEHNAIATRAFLDATATGYEKAAQDTELATRALIDIAQHPTLKDVSFVQASHDYIAPFYCDKSGQWGRMEAERWERFVQWLLANDIVKTVDDTLIDPEDLQADSLFTNAYFAD